MIPELLSRLTDLSLPNYISFRAAMAALTAFVLALVAGPRTIRWLRAHRVGEDVTKTDSVALAELAQRTGKHETTTMGGSFLVASLLVSVLLWCRLDNLQVVLALVLVAGKGHEQEQVVGDRRLPFCDREELEMAVRLCLDGRLVDGLGGEPQAKGARVETGGLHGRP